MNIDQENFNGIDGVDHFEALSKQNESQIFEIILSNILKIVCGLTKNWKFQKFKKSPK